MHVYEVRRRNDHRGVDPISDALPFGRLWYSEPNATSSTVGYAEHNSRSQDAVIRVYDDAGNVIQVQGTRAISKTREVLHSHRIVPRVFHIDPQTEGK